jgi:hypothetical protein
LVGETGGGSGKHDEIAFALVKLCAGGRLVCGLWSFNGSLSRLHFLVQATNFGGQRGLCRDGDHRRSQQRRRSAASATVRYSGSAPGSTGKGSGICAITVPVD